jgi:penicillin-insensitive murein endopeptidase
MRPWAFALGLICLLAWAAVLTGNDIAIAFEEATPSRSFGTPGNGRLEHGKRLPSRGGNFRVYSDLGALLGRNALHDPVRRSVVAAYAALHSSLPDRRFVYGETGWPGGGPFAPHKTHQNGMAVDFFVPVLDSKGASRFLPTHAFNKFGYGIEFDDRGGWRDYRIDFEAMAAHLDALDRAAHENGLQIELVIFDNELQRRLFDSRAGRDIANRSRFSRARPWVRHDEHYHVVFEPR